MHGKARGRVFAVAFVCAIAQSVVAATVNWIGPADGGLWSEAANWQDATTLANRVPGADDVATFTPSTFVTNTLDVATTVLGIKVNAGGTFTLNGDGTKKLTLGTNGIHAANATARTRMNVPIELSAGNVKFTTSTSTSDYTRYIDLNGVVSGPGRLYQSGLSAVLLRTNNTFTGGVYCYSSNTSAHDKGCIYVYKSDSLGGPDANGVYGRVTMAGGGDKRGGLYFATSGLTIENPIVATHNTRAFLFPNSLSALTFNGVITNTETFYLYKTAANGNNVTVTFNKPVVSSSKMTAGTYSIYMGDKVSSQIHFKGGVDIGKSQFSIYNRGMVNLYDVPGFTNTWYGLKGRGGCIICKGADVLPTASGASIAIDAYSVLDLGGHDQKLNRIYSTNGARTDTCIYSADSAATLELTQLDNVNSTWAGYVGGYHLDGTAKTFRYTTLSKPVTVVWNPKSKNTMTFSTQTSLTEGDLVVSNGTIALASSAKFTKIANLRIADGATFKVGSGSAINAKANVFIDGTGTIDLSSGQGIEVAAVTVNGKPVEKGATYVSTGSSASGTKVGWIAGDGAVIVSEEVVPPSSATWDGGAGASSPSIRTPANWVGDTLPDLTYGGLTPTFATGGAVAKIDTAIKLGGLAFAAAGDFTLSNGGGSITLKGGLAATGAHIYKVQSPVTMNGAQTWSVGDKSTVVANGPISCASGAAFTKIGAGRLTFTGENTFPGDLFVNGGDVCLSGPTATPGKSGVGLISIGTDKVLWLDNAVVRRPVTAIAYNYLDAGPVRAVAGTTNLILSAISVTENGTYGKNFCFWPEAGSRIVLAGGGSNLSWLLTSGPGELVISNKAISCAAIGVYDLSRTPTIRFRVGGNSVGSAHGDGFMLGGSARTTVHFEVNNAFGSFNGMYPYLTSPSKSSGSATLDLHGTTQRFDDMRGAYANGTITSDEPGAVLNVYQAATATNRWAINGFVTLNKSGAGTLAFAQSGATTGRLGVSAGTLRLLPEAKFQSVTNVTVTSTGRFAIESSDAIRKTCDLVLDGADARLSLGFEGTVSCNRLFLRTSSGLLRPAPPGLYGAPDNPNAKRTLANISGTGLLWVRAPGGFIMVIRKRGSD